MPTFLHELHMVVGTDRFIFNLLAASFSAIIPILGKPLVFAAETYQGPD